MLRDGRRLTLFRLRRADGSVDFTSGSLFDRGRVTPLSSSEFTITPGQVWASPSSSARYPIAWTIDVPAHGISFSVRARVPSCELPNEGGKGEPTYWEGPVASDDESAIGYLEMTGYAGKVSL